jgi:hypothetical protein
MAFSHSQGHLPTSPRSDLGPALLFQADIPDLQVAVLRPSHQLERGCQPQAALAGECDAFELAAVGSACSGEADADLITAEHWVFPFRRRVLLVEHLALPAAVSRGIGSEIVEERIAAEDAAVRQDQLTLEGRLWAEVDPYMSPKGLPICKIMRWLGRPQVMLGD